MKKCDICWGDIEPQTNDKGEVVWDQGDNAEPIVAEGRCCTSCNNLHVIPIRMLRVSRALH
jgi:hypothetical protein